MRKIFPHNESGHSLIEILTVSAIIAILATVPVSYLREAKIRANETAAMGALNQIAAAYEMYRVVGGRDSYYPHFYSDGTTTDLVQFQNGEQIWDKLVSEGLLPSKYRGYTHNTPNLLAPGYYFSIYPIEYGLTNRFSISPWDSYAFALIPVAGTRQPRTLALMHGTHFGHYFTNARAYKNTSTSTDLSDVKIFTFKDPEPD